MAIQYILAAAAVCCTTATAYAAPGNNTDRFTVKGVLVDSLTREGEAYATVSVSRKDNPANILKKAVTDDKGRFNVQLTGTGSYRVTLYSLGRTTVTRDIDVTKGKREIDLGTLFATDAHTTLKGVEVVMQKPLVKSDIDKIEYDIENDPDSKTNNVLDMLRKVPLVTVDGEESIRLNGNTSFKVYVNGKPNNLMSNNPKEVLKSMPANSIKKIEVITNPGPKYDAEGVGGILNIITVGSGFDGYTVTVNGSGNNRGGGGGFFGTIKAGKLTVSARYNYSYNSSPRNYNGGTRKTTGETDENSSDIVYDGSSKGHGNFQYGNIEASYEIDSLNLVTASFGLWGGGNKSDARTTTAATSPLSGANTYSYAQLSRSDGSWYSIEGGIDLQHTFRNVKERLLTFSYKINSNPISSDSFSDYDDMEAAPEWQDFIRRMTIQRNDGQQSTTEHTFQIDYTTPIAKIHTLETGVKYILRDNKSENDRYTRQTEQTDYTFDENYSSHYNHRNDILAGYVGYGLKLKKVSARLGMRYEHTFQNVEYKLGRGDDFSKNFDDFVPSASMGYKLTDMQNIRLGYNMRIYRPGIWFLNPYLDDSNPNSISQGNPNLNSEKSHELNLSYNNFSTKLNFSITAGFSFTNNRIERYASLINDKDIAGVENPTGKNVLYTTYRNIGKTRSANFSGYLSWNITSTTNFYTNVFGGYTYYNDGHGQKNSGWNITGFGVLQQSLPCDWRISLGANASTPWITLQGKGSSNLYYNINATKSFMKKRLSISAFASNIFSKYRKRSSFTESLNFRQDTWNKYCQRYFGINVSYRFGELKASVKKVERSISNDDVKGGNSNGQSN